MGTALRFLAAFDWLTPLFLLAVSLIKRDWIGFMMPLTEYTIPSWIRAYLEDYGVKVHYMTMTHGNICFFVSRKQAKYTETLLGRLHGEVTNRLANPADHHIV